VPRFITYVSGLQLTYVINLGTFCPLEKNWHILTSIVYYYSVGGSACLIRSNHVLHIDVDDFTSILLWTSNNQNKKCKKTPFILSMNVINTFKFINVVIFALDSIGRFCSKSQISVHGSNCIIVFITKCNISSYMQGDTVYGYRFIRCPWTLKKFQMLVVIELNSCLPLQFVVMLVQ
jgi:hypothetical protein